MVANEGKLASAQRQDFEKGIKSRLVILSAAPDLRS
jgi:hypothetical protein